MIREGIDAIVFDLDGVIYRGDVPIDGATAAVDRLRNQGVRLLFCTNNSRSTVDQYVARLHGMGLEVSSDEILTSAVVSAEVLAQRGLAGTSAVVVGGDGLRAAMRSIDVTIVADFVRTDVDLVVVGWDPSFTYDAMRQAALAVRAGAEFIATNDDAAFPAPDGLWPGAGAILASIEVGSGRRAEVMGKPHAPMMEAAEARLAGARRIAIVGDRPETDLLGGAARGWTTVLVLSGVTRREEVPRVDPVPDLVIESLAELI